MNNFLKLAERCEKASGHDSVLAKDIYSTLHGAPEVTPSGQYGWKEDDSGWWLATGEDARTPPKTIYPPHWLTSLDAAMTLVPEGPDGVLLNCKVDSFYISPGRRGHVVYLFGPFTGAQFTGRAATPALALTAACLRARAAI